MWATMGIRYDIVYAVKELSRVLQEPTKIAQQILDRTLTYITQSHNAHLIFDHDTMASYTLPPTRKKPTQQTDIYNVDEYTTDPVPHHDDKEPIKEYTYKGPQCMIIHRSGRTTRDTSIHERLPALSQRRLDTLSWTHGTPHHNFHLRRRIYRLVSWTRSLSLHHHYPAILRQ
jgi:hypothetical protein